MKQFNRVLSPLVLAASMTSTANASVVAYDSLLPWINAVAGNSIVIEAFNGAASSFTANSNGNSLGLLSMDLLGGGLGSGNVPDPGPTGLTGTGFMVAEVDSSPFVQPAPGEDGDGLELTVHTPSMTGFALLGLQGLDDFDMPDASEEVDVAEIAVEINGDLFLLGDILNPGANVSELEITGGNTFFGFVSSAPIDSFRFVHGDNVREVDGGFEHFALDAVMIAQAPTEVPLPGAVGLFALGLAGLGAVRKKQHA